MRPTVGRMHRPVSDRERPASAGADSQGERVATDDIADFEWPPSDELINSRIVEVGPQLTENSQAGRRETPARTVEAQPPPVPRTLRIADPLPVVPVSHELPVFHDLIVETPARRAQEPAAETSVDDRKHDWTSKEVWIRAIRSPDVIAAVLALVVTVVTAMAVRLDVVQSVSAMNLTSLVSPAGFVARSEVAESRRPAAPIQAPVAPPPLTADRTDVATAVQHVPRSTAPQRGLAARSDRSGAAIPIKDRVRGQSSRASEGVAGSALAGWISIASTLDIDIFERGVLVGTSRSPRIMLEAGPHVLEFVNEPTGFRTLRQVDVQSGHIEQVGVDLPLGTLHVNAVPWAEIWIDGKLVGQTPIGNYPIAIGPHRVVFRHPLLGEKEIATVVRQDTPARLTARLTQAEP